MREVLRALRKGMHIDTPGPDGATLLIIAAQNGWQNIVRELLRKGADAELYDNRGRSAEELASKFQYFGILKMLRRPIN